ncbi:MAG: tRNA uridine-5-carboxymethylaminomethyl(34) synthesis GTPase MnmE [Paludibacteraceae bacterium]|nr:tRNA uridine-5-carboxymethylaminomethyl(34) synthesis GTPase MnmE [Paludibacteraceae bacterium]
MIQTETIAAISTAPGVGGIAVIRVSGQKAISICDSLFIPNHEGRRLSLIKAQQAVYGTFANIDQVVATLYKSPYSFTGEDVVEISCHGSLYIQNVILQRLIEAGCRLADHGEFTMRAFLNGRIDLAEAEAVADLIGAKSAEAHRLALKQMQGALSTRLCELRDKLLELTSLLELELDFSDHDDVEFADRTRLTQLTKETEQEINRLMLSFDSGNAIRNGITIAIVGAPNAGKSTLLNRLVGDDCAIVSDIPGTTRDTIERSINYRGLLFRFIDTAGIHDTEDTIERLGIERSYKAINNARIIIALSENGDFSTVHLDGIPNISKIIFCHSKSDICTNCEDIAQTNVLKLSARTGYNIDSLMQRLYDLAEIDQTEDVIITTQRHYEALRLALEDIKKVGYSMSQNIPSDLIAEDLRSCLNHLGEITGGTITADETLQNIFSHFCIGK